MATAARPAILKSQVLPWIEKTREKYERAELIVVESFQNRSFKENMGFYKECGVLRCCFLWPLLGMPSLWLNVFCLYFRLFKHRKLFSDAVIHCRTELMSYFAIKLAMLYGSKNFMIISDVRGDSIDEIANYDKSALLKYLIDSVFMACLKYSCNKADIISCVTSNLIEVLEERTGMSLKSKAIVIPTIVSEKFAFNEDMRRLKRKELGISETYMVWIYSGSLANWQNPELLVQFVDDKLKDKNNYVVFLTNQINEAKKMFAMQLSSERLYISNVTYGEMPAFLNAADYGFIIRDNKSTNMVACPIKLAEYICSGLVIHSAGKIGLLTDLRVQLERKYANRKERSLQLSDYFDIDVNFNRLCKMTVKGENTAV